MKNRNFPRLLPVFLLALASSPCFGETPVSYWAFEGNANDSAGSANGTLNGTAGFSGTVPGALGHSTQALQLNAGGANDGFVFADPFTQSGGTLTVSGSYTVSLWTNLDTTTGAQTFFSTRGPADTSFDAKLTNGNLIHGDIGNGSAWLTTAADGAFANSAGVWNHIVYVVKPDGWQVFANGLEVGSAHFAASTPVLFDATHSLNIGRYQGNAEYFHGLIDDVAVYNSALSPQQVVKLSQGSSPTTLPSTVVGRSYHGAIGYAPITDDANSGIDPGKTYTHLLDFGSSGTATVNTVAFTQGNPGGGEGRNYGASFPSVNPGNANHQTTGGIAAVFQDMAFNNSDGVISLGGLTPGQAYQARLYVRNWADAASNATFDRTQVIEYDTDGDGVAERTVRLNPDDARAKGALFSEEHQAYALTYNFVADSPVLRINTNQAGGGSYHLYGVSNEETDRYPIDTLFSTGMDANGDRLVPGTPDPHYILTSSPGNAFGAALAITNHPAWAPNDENSQFVSVQEPGTSTIPAGEYTFQTSFDLTGFDTTTVEIEISLFVDNVARVFLNGVDTGLSHAGFALGTPGFLTLTDGLNGSGFLSGANTLEFLIENQPPDGPGGFMAELNGTGQLIPEPGTFALALLALASLTLRRRRS